MYDLALIAVELKYSAAVRINPTNGE